MGGNPHWEADGKEQFFNVMPRRMVIRHTIEAAVWLTSTLLCSVMKSPLLDSPSSLQKLGGAKLTLKGCHHMD